MAAELEKEIESDKINYNSTSPNLPDVVASMEMLTVDSEMSSSSSGSSTSNGDLQQTRYNMRKRIPRKVTKAAPSEVLNRRCSLRPKKRSYSAMENDGKIEEYYLDRNIKKKPNTKLETIYEEINGISENTTMISGRSFKRLIQFNRTEQATEAKIKKRKAKIKRVFGSKFKLKSGRVTMQALVKKLNGIRSELQSSADS